MMRGDRGAAERPKSLLIWAPLALNWAAVFNALNCVWLSAL
jgi:hypothetical protein